MASFLGYSRDTVAVALNYFDRYTCARPCSPTLAQAAAATALHIAAKFEESNPAPLVSWLVGKWSGYVMSSVPCRGNVVYHLPWIPSPCDAFQVTRSHRPDVVYMVTSSNKPECLLASIHGCCVW